MKGLPQAGGARQIQRSRMFAALMSRLSGRTLTVLDVGSAMPETVSFFSGTRCRLVFADLFDDVCGGTAQAPPSAWWQERFERGLALAPGSRFDLCLFWDALNFLDAPALRALSSALQPFMHKDSLGFGLGLQQGTRRLLRQNYAIRSDDTFVVRALDGAPEWPCFAHTPALLPQYLPMFQSARAVLLSNGRLEYSLAASGVV